ncbi:MAG TPA: hypothetical protein VFE62_26175 [Gemmataceae bacterium]|jgi:hypothetical protein|nr:hypothetical protein [Gemmataceae bacterium]
MRAAIYPGKGPLPKQFGNALRDLSDNLGMPVWMVAAEIEPSLPEAFRLHASRLRKNESVALLIDSPGGDARAAFQLARMLCRRCEGFVAVVPDQAMSAATLLTLGAGGILMAQDASLGPLDAQIWDRDLEQFTSGLNEVQSLERLRAYALDSVDASMFMLVDRMEKRTEVLLPHVLKFVSDTVRPLYESIDIVHYNERARILKVAEEYAVRLLRHHFPIPDNPRQRDRARDIASRLVESYPEHGFFIDREEAKALGLNVLDATGEQDEILERLWRYGRPVAALGPVEEVTT